MNAQIFKFGGHNVFTPESVGNKSLKDFNDFDYLTASAAAKVFGKKLDAFSYFAKRNKLKSLKCIVRGRYGAFKFFKVGDLKQFILENPNSAISIATANKDFQNLLKKEPRAKFYTKFECQNENKKSLNDFNDFDFLAIKTALERFKISRRFLYNAIEKGDIKPLEIKCGTPDSPPLHPFFNGHKIRFIKVADLKQFVKNDEPPAPADKATAPLKNLFEFLKDNGVDVGKPQNAAPAVDAAPVDAAQNVTLNDFADADYLPLKVAQKLTGIVSGLEIFAAVDGDKIRVGEVKKVQKFLAKIAN